jgi:hypothetical protein
VTSVDRSYDEPRRSLEFNAREQDGKSPRQTQSPGTVTSQKTETAGIPVRYKYKTSFTDEEVSRAPCDQPMSVDTQIGSFQLSHLLGAQRKHFGQRHNQQIFQLLPLGFFWASSQAEGEAIEMLLRNLLPHSTNKQVVRIDERLLLLVASPAAEHVLQQSDELHVFSRRHSSRCRSSLV